jgi:endonuclease/exonuclease/phosphatase family metal-dependent hydrolase
VYKDRDDIDRLADKGCTLIEGEKDGKTFQLAGTHLQAGRKYKLIRELQFSQISKILNIFKRKGIPQILAGDLNTDVKSPEFPLVLKNLGMKNYPICDERPFTSDGINSWNSDEKNPSQIDFVLLNANDTKSEIVEQFIERPYMVYDEKRMDYSDHFGILSIIKL